MKAKTTAGAWHWKITPEQITKIKAGERETINRVYFDNLPTFERMARKYCRHFFRLYEFLGDCVNQIYVDMPDYDYNDALSLYFSIHASFARASLANRRRTVSLDLPVKEKEGATLGDFIEGESGFEALERKEHEKTVLTIIAGQNRLTELQRDYLTAYAFNCRVYRGIYAEEYKKANAC